MNLHDPGKNARPTTLQLGISDAISTWSNQLIAAYRDGDSAALDGALARLSLATRMSRHELSRRNL